MIESNIKKRDPEVIKKTAVILADLYNTGEFGGKKKGRFQITHKNLRKLMRLPRLRDKHIILLSDELLEEYDILIAMYRDSFIFLGGAICGRYRIVPNKFFKNLGEDETEGENK